MDGLCRKTNESQHIPFRNETSSSDIIFYIKRAGVVHPCVRERTGKRHSLFRKTSHHLDLQSLFVDNAESSYGLIKRAVAKLAVLPIDSEIVGTLPLPTGGVCSEQIASA